MTKHDLLIETWGFLFQRVVEHDFPELPENVRRQHCDAIAKVLYYGLAAEQVGQSTGALNAFGVQYSVKDR
jgi:hypothetical protein